MHSGGFATLPVHSARLLPLITDFLAYPLFYTRDSDFCLPPGGTPPVLLGAGRNAFQDRTMIGLGLWFPLKLIPRLNSSCEAFTQMVRLEQKRVT